MKRQIQIIFFLLIVIQNQNFSQPSASINFMTAFPMGEFSEFNNNVGYGGSIEMFFFSSNDNVPYGFGMEFSYVNYGMKFISDPYTDDFYLSLNGSNNFTSAKFIFQIAPHTGVIRPYIETVFGGSFIYSYTEFYNSSLWVSDWSWNYGAGFGVKFLSAGNPFSNRGSIYFDLKVRYLFGTAATYLDRESLAVYRDTVEYSLAESKTDVITASIGFYFYF
jgi:hypothetical protein